MSEYAHLKSNVLSPNFKHFGHIDTFFEVAVLPSGYPFFQWNGRVYEVIHAIKFPMPIYMGTDKLIEDFE